MNGNTTLTGAVSHSTERTAAEQAAAGRYRGDRNG